MNNRHQIIRLLSLFSYLLIRLGTNGFISSSSVVLLSSIAHEEVIEVII